MADGGHLEFHDFVTFFHLDVSSNLKLDIFRHNGQPLEFLFRGVHGGCLWRLHYNSHQNLMGSNSFKKTIENSDIMDLVQIKVKCSTML